jgi:hypothetical protein
MYRSPYACTHSVVTVLSQLFHSGVTVLSQCCHSGVKLVSVASRWFQSGVIVSVTIV